MNQDQSNHFDMYVATQDHMNNNPAVWSGVPVIVTVKNNFDELVSRMAGQSEKAQSKLSVTGRKEILIKQTGLRASELSGSLQAFAAITNKPDLMKEVDFTKSDAVRMKEKELVTYVGNMIKIARNNLAALTDYAITDEQLTELETTLEDLNDLIGKPRNILNQKYVAIGQLSELFDTCNKLLRDQMDKLMLRYRTSNPEFYEGYLRARTIVDR